MGIKKNQIGGVAAASTDITSLLGGIGAGFYNDPVGKALLSWDMPSSGEVVQDTSIVLAPTAAVWSMFPWQLEAVEEHQGTQLVSKIYEGFIVFSDIVGDPAARFGSGIGDPGYSANQQNFLTGAAYSQSSTTQVCLAQLGNTANRPIEIDVLGEISLWYINNGGGLGYARGIFTVGQEIVLPFSPVAPAPP